MIDTLRFTGIAGTYDEARRYTRTHAKSFYFASHVLPREKRRAAYAVYAFCRFADNVADEWSETDRKAGLDLLRIQLHRVYAGSDEMDAGLQSFRETVERYAIPEEYFLDLFRGMEMDLVRSRYETFAELEDYCYCVASVVGLIMAKVFGVTAPEADRHARDLGTAMQLTNILRDIREDLGRDRVYLPKDELRAFSVSTEELQQGILTPQFTSLMAMQVARARDYYASGRDGLKYIPDDGSRYCARLMSDIYSGILERIEWQSYDVFSRRAMVPVWEKLRIAARAW
jgi:phytoene synthase